MSEPVYVQWRTGKRSVSKRHIALVPPLSPWLIRTGCGVVIDGALVTRVERGANPCRTCVRALGA